MSARKLLFGLVLFLGVGFFYRSTLPYFLSHQDSITTADLTQNGYYDKSEEVGVFEGQEVSSFYVPPALKLATVLGDTTTNKRIEVDLSNQKVYAYEGDNRVFEFTVSTGKWGRTPTGTFSIEYKTAAQKMSGGNKALGTYYYLPNVQFVQFFGNSTIPWSRGFGLHGTYWHNNFGHPMSHGCVNLKNEDAEKLFYWTGPHLGDARTIKATPENPGTPVIIYGITPTG